MSYQSRKNSPARLLREPSWSDLNVTSTDFSKTLIFTQTTPCRVEEGIMRRNQYETAV